MLCRRGTAAHALVGMTEAETTVRPRARLALAGVLIVALVAVLGFAAFSPDRSATPSSTSLVFDAPLPSQLTGRVAGAIFATDLGPNPDDTTTTVVENSSPTTP